MTDVEVPSKPEMAQGSIRQQIGEWAAKNARLLFWLVLILSIPYLMTCWGIALVMMRGSCGG